MWSGQGNFGCERWKGLFLGSPMRGGDPSYIIAPFRFASTWKDSYLFLLRIYVLYLWVSSERGPSRELCLLERQFPKTFIKAPIASISYAIADLHVWAGGLPHGRCETVCEPYAELQRLKGTKRRCSCAAKPPGRGFSCVYLVSGYHSQASVSPFFANQYKRPFRFHLKAATSASEG